MKRRRSLAAPVNRLSMAGVSHTILIRASAPDPLASAPSTFTMRGARVPRTPPGGACTPVPISISSAPANTFAATAQPPAPPLRTSSEKGKDRRPRPAVKSEMASRQLVLPAPFAPNRTAGAGPGRERGSAIVAEIRQRELGDPGAVFRRPCFWGESCAEYRITTEGITPHPVLLPMGEGTLDTRRCGKFRGSPLPGGEGQGEGVRRYLFAVRHQQAQGRAKPASASARKARGGRFRRRSASARSRRPA